MNTIKYVTFSKEKKIKNFHMITFLWLHFEYDRGILDYT